MEDHGFKLKTTGRREVEEYPWGVYVWEIEENGEKLILADEEGNFMLIQSTKGDKKRIQMLADAARSYGYPDGKPVFWSGKRPITDEEYEEQLMRAKLGLVPDPLDINAIREQERAKHLHGG